MAKNLEPQTNVRWGIIGLGKIAKKFADDLALTQGCTLFAVASRDIEKAKTFAREYKVEHPFGSYEELVLSNTVDAIYVATPHSFHMEHSMLALEKKIPTLCEKPLGLNLDQVEKMISFAKLQHTLLMEALWTRFLPSFQKVKQLAESQELGKITMIEADFGFDPVFNPEGRLFNKKLGGGSLLDIGIYPIFLAVSLLGEPVEVKVKASFFKTGADASVDMVFTYTEGVEAKLSCSLLEKTSTQAIIHFEKGRIKMHPKFHKPTSITVSTKLSYQTTDYTSSTYGYHYEILHFNELVRAKQPESNLMTYDLSLALMRTIERVKQQIGLSYKSS